MATPPLATLRATLALAVARRSRAYWQWQETCRAVRRLTKELRRAEAQERAATQAAPQEERCSS